RAVGARLDMALSCPATFRFGDRWDRHFGGTGRRGYRMDDRRRALYPTSSFCRGEGKRGRTCFDTSHAPKRAASDSIIERISSPTSSRMRVTTSPFLRAAHPPTILPTAPMAGQAVHVETTRTRR